MRVLQVHTRYREPGGEDSVVEAERRLLADAGHDVRQHLLDNPTGAVDTAAALLRSPWNRTAARALTAAVDAHRPDVVHVHNTWFALSPAALPALADRRVPTVVSLHNYRYTCAAAVLHRDGALCELCVGRSPLPGVRHRCYRGSLPASAAAATTIALHRRRGTLARDADVLVTFTAFGRDKAVEAGLPAERVVVLPHACGDPGGRPQPPSASRDVVYVGRLSREKGLDTLLDAASTLPALGLRLVVVGDGPEGRRLAGRLPRGVTLRGRLPASDVHALLLRARTLVFPSEWYETFGMVLIEAMAAGLPVVASELGGNAETVGDAGWLVSPGDAGAWAAALARLGDDGAVDAVGAAARGRWAAAYTPSAKLAGLEAVYERARTAAAVRR